MPRKKQDPLGGMEIGMAVEAISKAQRMSAGKEGKRFIKKVVEAYGGLTEYHLKNPTGHGTPRGHPGWCQCRECQH